MNKSAEKPKRKIDRSKKKRKVRSKVNFNVALGHKDLRSRSHAATIKRCHGKNEIERINLPENRTYDLPSTSEEDSDEENFSEDDEILEENNHEQFDINSLRNLKINSDTTDFEKEYFDEIVDETRNLKLNGNIRQESTGAERKIGNENLEDTLDALLNLDQPDDSPLIKTIKFNPTVSKSKWRSGDANIIELEKHLDSILDDM